MKLAKLTPDQQRFLAKVRMTESCWIWTGAYDSYGRGNFRWNGKVIKAHIASYRLFVGAIPPGKDLDHLCRNRGCVNFRHLEPVTHRENLMRGNTLAARNAAKTHCPQGHAYTPENTIVDRRGKRQCRTCNRMRKRAVA